MMASTEMDELFEGLTTRRPPQVVARVLVDMGAQQWLDAAASKELFGLAAHQRVCSMPDRFREHPGVSRAYRSALEAMRHLCHQGGLDLPMIAASDEGDPAAHRAWVDRALDMLGFAGVEPDPVVKRPVRERQDGYLLWYGFRCSPGQRGSKHGHVDVRDGLTAVERRKILPGVSVRAYRRAVRAVTHLQQRVDVWSKCRDVEACVAFGKSRLASTIDYGDFAASPETAAFVAYYVSRLGLRTIFTNGSQVRPMDTLGEALLEAALGAVDGRPDVIARVLTRQSVLSRLSDAQKGELLGCYYSALQAASRALDESFDYNRDRTHMVVRRGDDSSTWNVASRAFNQARTGWLNLTQALGVPQIVEAQCPGKVPALVASDVAFWHDGSEHDDVHVWADLPLPWKVVLDGVDCPADLVRSVCRDHGLDPAASGWTQPYRQGTLEATAPAPELVHGVQVACPYLATVLRAAGVFSGK